MYILLAETDIKRNYIYSLQIYYHYYFLFLEKKDLIFVIFVTLSFLRFTAIIFVTFTLTS